MTPLTQRELEARALASAGVSQRDAARILGITRSTYRTLITRANQKASDADEPC